MGQSCLRYLLFAFAICYSPLATRSSYPLATFDTARRDTARLRWRARLLFCHSCTRPQAGHTILRSRSGAGPVRTPRCRWRPMAGRRTLIMMIPTIFSSIRLRPAGHKTLVDRVTGRDGCVAWVSLPKSGCWRAAAIVLIGHANESRRGVKRPPAATVTALRITAQGGLISSGDCAADELQLPPQLRRRLDHDPQLLPASARLIVISRNRAPAASVVDRRWRSAWRPMLDGIHARGRRVARIDASRT